jgi:hypothetical protein
VRLRKTKTTTKNEENFPNEQKKTKKEKNV